MNTNENILYIGGFQLPDKNAAAHRVVNNGKALNKLGYQVYFIGVSKERTNIKSYKPKDNYKCFFEISYPTSFIEWSKYLVSIKYIKEFYNIELKKKLSIIIAYNYPSFALWRLKWFCKKNGIRIFADVTEWYVAEGNLLFRAIKNFDTLLRMRHINFQLDGIIAISRFLYDFYNEKVKTILIPPLVDIEDEKWKQIEKDNKNITFLYAGSPGSGMKDRIDTLVNAFSSLEERGISNYLLEIVGITKEDFSKLFNQVIPEISNERIKFFGRLSHLDTINEIKKADYFIFFREENLVTKAGFPTKFAEAISCGTPILTNKVSNIAEYVVEGKNGFIINSIEKNTIAEALLNIIEAGKERIMFMKKYCAYSNSFDYNRFIDDISKLTSFKN